MSKILSLLVSASHNSSVFGIPAYRNDTCLYTNTLVQPTAKNHLLTLQGAINFGVSAIESLSGEPSAEFDGIHSFTHRSVADGKTYIVGIVIRDGEIRATADASGLLWTNDKGSTLREQYQAMKAVMSPAAFNSYLDISSRSERSLFTSY